MYIIQMADLHVGAEGENSGEEKKAIQLAIQVIKNKIEEGEKCLLCVCGDLIDSKGLKSDDKQEVNRRYQLASQVLSLFRNELKNLYKLDIKFCLGNHDVTHLDEFVEFAKEFDASISKSQLENCYSYDDGGGTEFIFVNSCYSGIYDKGKIDFDTLEGMISSSSNAYKILVLHHTIMSMDEEDGSSIRDAARLIGLINTNNVIGVLHGHIHGRDILTVGNNKCRVIGTGALFARNYDNVNSQFNVIHYKKGVFNEIWNYRYFADGTENKWEGLSIGNIGCDNFIKGNSFKEVYCQLIDRLDVMSPLYNVVLQITSGYNDFVESTERYVEKETLSVGKNTYTYMDLAKKWEADKVPDELYFNHGSFFQMDDKHGIYQIAEHLSKRSTSNRAVLSTYNMENIKNNIEGKEFLPSLSTVQFSLDNDGQILYVHMHLRALEAGRFLKINMCEIVWLLNILKEEGILFKKVNVVVSAFRVQVKEKFSCFIKTQIDKEAFEDLTVLASTGNIEVICEMLEEKKDITETITNYSGIENLYKGMQACNRRDGFQYNDIIMGKMGELMSLYRNLDRIQNRQSIPTIEEKEYEKDIEKKINEIIQELKVCKKQEQV